MIGSIRFAGDLHPAIVIGGALLAAGLVMWLYLRESRSLASPYNYLLPSLRASAVAMVILVLAGPVWHRRQVVGTLGRVVFAVDTSQSMSMIDSGAEESNPTRLERAVALLNGKSESDGWLSTLSKTHVVDVLSFDEGEPTLVWSSEELDGADIDRDEASRVLSLEPDGMRTDISSGLLSTLASLAPTHVDSEARSNHAAVVVISDGRDNAGGGSLEVAKNLNSSGIRVHAIGMGSEDEPSDIGITNVIRPDSVASDGVLAGELMLKQVGLNGREVKVRIESDGEVVWQKTVQASAQGQQKIPFLMEVEPIVDKLRGDSPRGVRRSTEVMDLRAVVEAVEGDTRLDNNVIPFRVAASTRDRRLLVFDGSSRWETRYIRNLFDRDPAWVVDTVLCGAGTDMPILRRGDEEGQFPGSREAISQYDAVVLGEVPPDQLEERDAVLLRDFVTRGGGLIVIDGRYQRLQLIAEKRLPELIPVEYLPEPVMPVRSLRPGRLGLDHPVLNLWGDKDQLAEFWNKLPAPIIAPRVEAREGAEVWADAVGRDGRESPWLVTRLFGAGRVFYLSTDQTWRWRYKVADRFHARFWNQLLAAVMQPPYSASDDYVALGTDKIEYEPGRSATIRVRLQDNSGKPVGDATVDALLVSNDQVVGTVPLLIDDPARGTYRGQTPPLETGAYSVRVRASGFDANALQATTPIWVGNRGTVELNHVSLDSESLVQMTAAAGGMYLHESSSEKILEALQPLSTGSVVESDILVWQSFYWFWIVLLLLGIEWWMRKQAGLV